mgnify:CR=1 FL=1
MSADTRDIMYYRRLLKRRKLTFLIPFILLLLLATVVVSTLPPVYSSQATILVEAQNIPKDMVRSTVTGYVEERLQTLTQIVLSRSNLKNIIEKFNLYAQDSDDLNTEQIISNMRKNIKMEPIQAQVSNPQYGRTTTATIAFHLAYENQDPQIAAQVSNALVSLYLEQNLREREEKAEGTVQFFQEQLASLRQEIAQQESAISRFKEENMHSLPELMQYNMQMLERTKNEIEAKQNDLHTLMNRLMSREGQLAVVELMRYWGSGNTKAMSLEEEYRILNNQYLSMKAVKAHDHPDLVRLRNQLKSLGQETSSRHMRRDVLKNLERKQSQLAQLREKYSRNHPDVIRLEKEVDSIKTQLKKLSSTDIIVTNLEDIESENPTFINLQTQISSTKLDIQNVKSKVNDLENIYAMYQQRIERSPQVEQEYQELQRDYASAQQNYQTTMGKLQTALEAQELEEGHMAEKLKVIEPPQVPQIPVKPNRRALGMLGFVFAAGMGVSSTALAEYFDTSIRDLQGLKKISTIPVLGAIPYVRTRRDIVQRVIIRLLFLLGLVAAACVFLTLLHLYYLPLDILWLKLQETIGL